MTTSFNRNTSTGISTLLIMIVCLGPCLFAFGDALLDKPTSVILPVRQNSALAMHIHMVHIHAYDLREGKAVARFEFHNAGTKPLKIVQIKPSCGCVTARIAQPKQGYLPQAAGEFFLESDTAAEAPGAHEYIVKIDYQLGDDNAARQQQEVTFRVDVPDKQITIRPRALIFYQLNEQPTTQQVTITDYRPEHELELLGLKLKSEFVEVSAPKLTLDQHRHRIWTFEITAAGQVPSGKQTLSLEIETNDAEFPQLRLPILLYGPQAFTPDHAPGT